MKLLLKKNVYISNSMTEEIFMDKLVSIEQFQKDPKLQAEFGGDHNKYLSSFIQKLNQFGIFNFDGSTLIPKDTDNIGGILSGKNGVKQTDPRQDKKFEEIVNNLDKIDPKYRPMIEAELNNGNVYRAFIYMQMVLNKSELLNEFSEHSKEADAQVAVSEKAYYAAVKAEQDAEKAQKAAERYLEEMIASYDEGDYHITEAQNKLRDLITGASDATLAREIAGDRLVAASKHSLKAFQSNMIAETMLGQSFNQRT